MTERIKKPRFNTGAELDKWQELVSRKVDNSSVNLDELSQILFMTMGGDSTPALIARISTLERIVVVLLARVSETEELKRRLKDTEAATWHLQLKS